MVADVGRISAGMISFSRRELITVLLPLLNSPRIPTANLRRSSFSRLASSCFAVSSRFILAAAFCIWTRPVFTCVTIF